MMMMNRFSFFAVLSSLLFVVVSINGEVVTHTDCPSPLPTGVGEVLEVRVTPCDPYGDGGCILYRNNDVTIEIDFKPKNDSETLNHKVHGVFWNVQAPYVGLGSSNACPKLSGDNQCPIEKGETYTYSAQFHVSRMYPAIPLLVQWQLMTEENTSQLCIRIPVKIQNPKSQ